MLSNYFSLRLIGEEGFGEIIDYTIHFAKDVAALIERNDDLEAINPEPEINAVVFRFKDDHQTDDVNKIIHRTLFKKEELLSLRNSGSWSNMLKIHFVKSENDNHTY
ncbi:hypothetical protein ACEQPO_08840 [Bacillus sp. SL00103]